MRGPYRQWSNTRYALVLVPRNGKGGASHGRWALVRSGIMTYTASVHRTKPVIVYKRALVVNKYHDNSRIHGLLSGGQPWLKSEEREPQLTVSVMYAAENTCAAISCDEPNVFLWGKTFRIRYSNCMYCNELMQKTCRAERTHLKTEIDGSRLHN